MLLRHLKTFSSFKTGTNFSFFFREWTILTSSDDRALKGQSRCDLSPVPASTCVTAGAVVGALVGALLAGVVTEGALVPLRKTPPLTPEAATALVEEPAGRGGTSFQSRLLTGPRAGCVCSGVQVPVRHHDAEQLVQSSLSGPVHCRHVMSHRWQFPCGLKYSPADGENTKSPLNHLL